MSKKTVSFALPVKAQQPGEGAKTGQPGGSEASVNEAGSDAWVSAQDDLTADPFRLSPAFKGGFDSPTFVVDLAAERSLTEVIGLSFFAPFALGWFWLMNAIAGRPRF